MTKRFQPATTTSELDVCVGKAGLLAGRLTYHQAGAREYSGFGYDNGWLASPECFEISPDLPLNGGYQTRRPPSQADSTFFLALADTEPDAWGRRVIARAHAKERQRNPELRTLTELDYLCAVDDFSRVGALRLRAADGGYLRTVDEGRRCTPPMLELEHMLAASRAVERSEETAADLQYLLGKGTSLGGMRPKCTVLHDNGRLALAKFPSISDTRSVTRAEVLALQLATAAGIDAATARIVVIADSPVALVDRFDRTADQGRIPYISGSSVLQARRSEERAYTEVVDAIRARCADPVKDARELWRRLAFNHLILNVDDHLQNIGFLHVGGGQWRLSPAFDLNPFPDKTNESKTWLSEDTGPITSVIQLLRSAPYFNLDDVAARAVLANVVRAVSDWRRVAQGPDVGMRANELEDFIPALEGAALQEARHLLA